MNHREQSYGQTCPVLLVAPAPPPYGGMALQGRLLKRLLSEDGNDVTFFPTNFPLPGWLERIPVLRTLLRSAWIWPQLWREMRQAEVVHILAASLALLFYCGLPCTVFLGRVRGKRVILNYRGGGAKQFFDRFGWAVAPFFRSASVVTAPSKFLAEIIESHFQASGSRLCRISWIFPGFGIAPERESNPSWW